MIPSRVIPDPRHAAISAVAADNDYDARDFIADGRARDVTRGTSRKTSAASANAVGRPRAANAIAFTATYELSFKQMIVTGHLEAAQLVVEHFSRFTDGSGRSSYYTKDTFVRGGFI